MARFGAYTPEADADLQQQIRQESGVLVRTFYYADYLNGSDNNVGTDRSAPLRTLKAAYDKCVAGRNDAVVVIGNGASTGFQRIGATFTWSKAATHLLGADSGVSSSPRASIRPTSGVTAFTPLMTISGSGCLFKNIGFWSGFTTGTTAQICLNVTGSYNRFDTCHIVGMADAASAADAGSRCLKIGSGGSGENEFHNCTIGVDTVTRSAANASVEFAGNTPRNKFVGCIFRILTDDATALGILGTGAACLDRDNSFIDCAFINQVKSTGTVMTALCTLPASAGGLILLKACTTVGMTDLFSDATTAAQMYVDGGPGIAATSGLAVNPA